MYVKNRHFVYQINTQIFTGFRSKDDFCGDG